MYHVAISCKYLCSIEAAAVVRGVLAPWDPFIELEDCIVFQVQDFSSPDQWSHRCAKLYLVVGQMFLMIVPRLVYLLTLLSFH